MLLKFDTDVTRSTTGLWDLATIFLVFTGRRVTMVADGCSRENTEAIGLLFTSKIRRTCKKCTHDVSESYSNLLNFQRARSDPRVGRL